MTRSARFPTSRRSGAPWRDLPESYGPHTARLSLVSIGKTPCWSSTGTVSASSSFLLWGWVNTSRSRFGPFPYDLPFVRRVKKWTIHEGLSASGGTDPGLMPPEGQAKEAFSGVGESQSASTRLGTFGRGCVAGMCSICNKKGGRWGRPCRLDMVTAYLNSAGIAS